MSTSHGSAVQEYSFSSSLEVIVVVVDAEVEVAVIESLFVWITALDGCGVGRGVGALVIMTKSDEPVDNVT